MKLQSETCESFANTRIFSCSFGVQIFDTETFLCSVYFQLCLACNTRNSTLPHSSCNFYFIFQLYDIGSVSLKTKVNFDLRSRFCIDIKVPFSFPFTSREWGQQQMGLYYIQCSGVGSVATRTLEWKVKIHQHLLNQSWLNFKICLLH